MGRAIGKSQPRAPDPYATAQAQGQVNADTARLQARLNRGDTVTPFGTVTNVDLGNDRWETRVALSPEQRRLYEQGVEIDTRSGQLALDQFQRIGGVLSDPLNTDGLPGWQPYVADRGSQVQRSVADRGPEVQRSVADRTPEMARTVDTSRFGSPDISRDRVESAILSRLEPQFQRDREALEGRLIAQGFTPGSEAYNRAADELSRSRNDARMQAVLAGGQEQSRIFGLGLQDADFINRATGQATEMDLARMDAANRATRQVMEMDLARMDAANRATAQLDNMDLARNAFTNNSRQAMLAERLQMRAQPINEISALFGLGPGMQTPQMAQLAQVGVNAPDLMGMVGQNYAQRAQMYGADMAALGQLLGTAGAAGVRYRFGR